MAYVGGGQSAFDKLTDVAYSGAVAGLKMALADKQATIDYILKAIEDVNDWGIFSPYAELMYPELKGMTLEEKNKLLNSAITEAPNQKFSKVVDLFGRKGAEMYYKYGNQAVGYLLRRSQSTGGTQKIPELDALSKYKKAEVKLPSNIVKDNPKLAEAYTEWQRAKVLASLSPYGDILSRYSDDMVRAYKDKKVRKALKFYKVQNDPVLNKLEKQVMMDYYAGRLTKEQAESTLASIMAIKRMGNIFQNEPKTKTGGFWEFMGRKEYFNLPEIKDDTERLRIMREFIPKNKWKDVYNLYANSKDKEERDWGQMIYNAGEAVSKKGRELSDTFVKDVISIPELTLGNKTAEQVKREWTQKQAQMQAQQPIQPQQPQVNIPQLTLPPMTNFLQPQVGIINPMPYSQFYTPIVSQYQPPMQPQVQPITPQQNFQFETPNIRSTEEKQNPYKRNITKQTKKEQTQTPTTTSKIKAETFRNIGGGFF